MKTKKINGKEYVSLENLKKFLEELYNDDGGGETTEEYDMGWEGCINSISDELDLMIGFESGKITHEVLRNYGENSRRKNAKKK
jgi:hypothetical protein